MQFVEQKGPRGVPMRSLTEDICKRYDYRNGVWEGKTVQAATYYSADGALVAQKLRFDGKGFTCLGDLSLSGLFGQHLWPEGGEDIIITEGEIDAMSVKQAIGMPAVSIPSGAQGARKAITKALPWLAKFRRVVLMFDNDDPGKKAAHECSQIIPGNVFVATLDTWKDANEALMGGAIQAIRDAFVKARRVEPVAALERADLLVRARRMIITEAPAEQSKPERVLYSLQDQTAKEMLSVYAKKMAAYDTLPIDVDGEVVRLYRGEWSIWSGFPGTGKTTLLRQTVCHLLKGGGSAFVATLEADPADFIIECAATAAGVEMPSETQLQAFLDQYGERLKVWGVIGIADHKKILATITQLAEQSGLKHAVIDSLMALDIDSGDYEEQRKFSNLVSAIARSKQVHIHLVGHPRKPMSPDQEPSVWDVAGSSDLGRLAFNVFFIRRGPVANHDKNITAMEFHVLKQRTRGVIGTINGHFYRKHRQFHLDAYSQEPKQYLSGDGIYPASGMTTEIPEEILHRNSFRVDRDTDASAPWEMT